MSFILYIATCERQNVTASSNQNLSRHYMTSPARSLKIVRPDFWLNCYDDTAQFSSLLVGVGDTWMLFNMATIAFEQFIKWYKKKDRYVGTLRSEWTVGELNWGSALLCVYTVSNLVYTVSSLTWNQSGDGPPRVHLRRDGTGRTLKNQIKKM